VFVPEMFGVSNRTLKPVHIYTKLVIRNPTLRFYAALKSYMEESNMENVVIRNTQLGFGCVH